MSELSLPVGTPCASVILHRDGSVRNWLHYPDLAKNDGDTIGNGVPPPWASIIATLLPVEESVALVEDGVGERLTLSPLTLKVVQATPKKPSRLSFRKKMFMNPPLLVKYVAVSVTLMAQIFKTLKTLHTQLPIVH
ncbi:hypothetical protein IPL68_00365 [Candidatus Saccharibacteria bacterium]|nr:MAG: hypothetical protein IPL68_00365 [Candidatus Saccharibacteria bacterium]